MFDAEDFDLAADVTLVTGFIDIGAFNKGDPNLFRTHRDYERWMHIFDRIYNPVVAFIETDDDVTLFDRIRASRDAGLRNVTRIERVTRGETWAFSLLPKIKQVLKERNYKKILPNTAVPEYQCIQHIKYEHVLNVATTNPFKTKYFAWIDIGLFRDIVDVNADKFKLFLPPDADLTRVAYGEVTPAQNKTNEEIFRGNLYWVCGCFFIGARPTIMRWTREYMRYTEKFLNEGLANSDQRVIYAMQKNEQPSMEIQVYKSRNKANPWFDLGYRCRDVGMQLM